MFFTHINKRRNNLDVAYKLVMAMVCLGLTYYIGYIVERSQFFQLIVSYTLFFVVYIYLLYTVSERKNIYFFVGVGILSRFLLLFSFPNLSDDIYRFIWDGHLLAAGIHPFNNLPTYYIEHSVAIQGISTELYERLNSPNYMTIYPPINQFIFWIGASFSPHSWWGNSVIIKAFLFLFELGTIYLIIRLLTHFQLPFKNILLYALNPLLILEIMGNVHFEGAMVFFLVLGVWLLVVKRNLLLSAIAIACSVASKLLPLIFLPFFIKRLYVPPVGEHASLGNNNTWVAGLQRNILFYGTLGIALLLLFLPLLNGVFIKNFGSSLNLYFQRFEFNASIYYLLRWVGFQYRGYNVIQTLGPFLSYIVLIGILSVAIFEKKPNWSNLFEKLLFAICFYLLLATTIHPWYVALPIVCCVFTRFRFPILWSGVIFLTYINYSYVVYQENLWIVALEYSLLAIFVTYELFYTRQTKKLDSK